MAAQFLYFIYNQIFWTPALPTADLSGHVYCVTGANTAGLGREAARHLVRMGAAKVIITSRNAAKGAAAKADIENTTGKKGVVEVWSLDHEDYDNVRAFAKRIDGLDRIDGVVENAAKATGKWEIVNGHESTIVVNVISTLYLGLLLLPKLRETARKYDTVPVLTTVSSEVHAWTPFNERHSSNILEACDKADDFKTMDRYPLTKLLQVYGSREVAKHAPIERDHVTINFINPGLCRSELARELDTWQWRLQQFLLARTSEVGGRTLVDAVLKGPASHGKYLTECKVSPCAPLVEGPEGPELQRRVWSELSAELERIHPGILKNLDT